MATPEPAHAPLFPYMWIRDRMTVGPYELISRNVLTDEDFVSAQLKGDVEGLLKMYETRASMSNPWGAETQPGRPGLLAQGR
jgi:hypothetical protein